MLENACRTMFLSEIARFVAQSQPLTSSGAAASSGTAREENPRRQRDSVSQRQRQEIRSCWCAKKWTEWRVWRDSAIKPRRARPAGESDSERLFTGSQIAEAELLRLEWLTVTAFKIFRPLCARVSVCWCVGVTQLHDSHTLCGDTNAKRLICAQVEDKRRCLTMRFRRKGNESFKWKVWHLFGKKKKKKISKAMCFFFFFSPHRHESPLVVTFRLPPQKDK